MSAEKLSKRVARLTSAPAIAIAIAVALTGPAAGQAAKSFDGIAAYTRAHQRDIVRELMTLLSIPNVSRDQPNIRKNAELLRGMLAQRGLKAELLETTGNPLVYGELLQPGATRTLLLYFHYDGQPVDPAGWKQRDPFQPILRNGRLEDGATEIDLAGVSGEFAADWRVYARSASDDKGPIVAFCAALDALKASGQAASSNIRVILDGEEEGGFGSLTPAIAKYRDRLRADAMLIFDGPVHASGRPTAVFGARGNLGVELTVFGPKFALHSGHYGNWIPNPGMMLARLLASMKDDDGRVLIEGFYDGTGNISAEERAMLDAVPDDPKTLLALFGVAQPERAGSLQDALQVPTLNIRGLASGFVGNRATTIIPDHATASIDVRLVKETPAAPMREKILAHIRRQGFHVVNADPTDDVRARYPRIVRVSGGGGTNAFRTSPLLPVSKLVIDRLAAASGETPVIIRTMGATVPITPFIDALGFPAILIPVVNFDNNQHADNENIKLGYLFKSVATFAALLTM